jgi:NAD(P) transhydrogenase subunit beta
MGHNASNLLYLVTIVTFIWALRDLSNPARARRGVWVGAAGMALAIATTFGQHGLHDYLWMVLAMVIGGAFGAVAARRVKMTAMPQMVALFNGVGGGAAALVSWAEFHREAGLSGDLQRDISISLVLSALIGSISFSGSMIAFAKLQELIGGRPITYAGQQVVNGLLFAAIVAAGVAIVAGAERSWLLAIVLVGAALFGILFVLPIGGADMPVVISLLNAFTGLSAAATGIALDNTALIVAGMLVGASGSILTNQMAVAMNRSVPAIIAGGFGGGGALAAGGDDDGDKSVRSTSADDVAIQLSYADKVVIVPGYGMAVAQAQHAVRELTDELEKRGVEVAFAIHPVAGRMPGHMNVLLAEADVPYDKLKEMDDINPEFATTDVSLVIGANDVTNPAAREQADSPIYGMPILDVDKSGAVIVLKRSMNSGFAGIDNPLFYLDNTSLLFGDAKASVADVLSEVKGLD